MAYGERSELRGTYLDGKYRLGDFLGAGGTGLVFEAQRVADAHPMVVKVLRPVFAQSPDLVRRLRREAEVARAVAHPGIVPVVDEGLLEDGSPYLVLERVGGESLAQVLLRRGRLSVLETAALSIRLASVLHVVHTHGYVHRDVKPEHVLLDRRPSGGLDVRLIDFGVCAAWSASREERERERGRVFGTPSYCSPEQAAGDPGVDGRADLFALGIVAFECLVGRLPFGGATVDALLRSIITQEAPRLSDYLVGIDPAFDVLVARAMARTAGGRPPSARAYARALLAHAGKRLASERLLAATLRTRTGQERDQVDTAVAAA
jgi:serine/threonine-protein kinase